MLAGFEVEIKSSQTKGSFSFRIVSSFQYPIFSVSYPPLF